MKNQNLTTKLFQFYIQNKDIREFKKNIFYYFFYRLLRNFFNEPIKIKIHNFYLFSNNNKNKASYSLLQKCDFFDIAEINLIKKVSNNREIFLIDCGCNFGFYSLYVSSLSKKNRVISIEASHETIKEFNENLILNNFDDVKSINKAVSDTDHQIVELKESDKDWESSIISSDYKVKNMVKIETVSVDTILKSEKIDGRCLILKIDVEGSDINVLAGAISTIKNHSPLIIIEFSKYISSNKKFNYEYLKFFLKEYSYLIYNSEGQIINLNSILKELEELDKEHKTIGNYYLIKENFYLIKELFNK